MNKWRLQCLDWCYARYEDGKFGDQKYLDVWPENYEGVHVLNNLGGGVAPWNIQQYKIFKKEDTLYLTKLSKQESVKLVFFHFQYVKLHSSGIIDIGWHYIKKSAVKLIYEPYINKILQAEEMLTSRFSEYKTGYSKFASNGVKEKLKSGFKKLTFYNLINLP